MHLGAWPPASFMVSTMKELLELYASANKQSTYSCTGKNQAQHAD